MNDCVKRSATRNYVILAVLALFSLATAAYPTIRAFYRFQVNYNEGWNVYNTQAVAQHAQLYTPKYSWTLVQYPPFSFYVIRYLSYFGGNYLLAGRLLSLFSLALSSLIVGLIIARLTQQFTPALFGALFCLTLFCSESADYIGMDDPQLFAQIFFLSGLLVYISRPRSFTCIGVVVFLFVFGGLIKHNLLDFPLAVFLDLCFVSRRRAAQFLFWAIVLVGASVGICTLVFGPFFITKLLSPRAYSGVNAIRAFLNVYGPIQLAFIAAFLWALKSWAVESERVISLFFFSSLLVGIGFSGGAGAASNYFFDNFLAISVLFGTLIHFVWRLIPDLKVPKLWGWSIPFALFSSLLYAFCISGDSRLGQRLAELPRDQQRFESQVAFLKLQPGLALCESLLTCYDAGKPYIYDPAGSTNLMNFDKLDRREIVGKIETLQYGAIQLKGAVESLKRPNDHFPDELLYAISRYYAPALKDPDCYIYVPRRFPVANEASLNKPSGGVL
jgi:hypothetical protein